MSRAPSVLCAVDLSHRSAKVLQHAGAVAEHFRARLVAASVARPGAPSPGALTALVNEVLPVSSDCRVRVVGGAPAAAILRLAHDENVDLLVIGTHGNGSSAAGSCGSTTRTVLAHADLPVLVVPNSASDLHSFDERCELDRLGRVLAPIDFSACSRRDARIAAGIADALGLPLLLVHVCPLAEADGGLSPAAARERLAELRQDVGRGTPGATIETLAVSGEPAAAIAAIATERNAGLVVMGLHGSSGTAPLRPGSIASRMLCATPTMLLALPAVLRSAATTAAAPQPSPGCCADGCCTCVTEA